MFENYFLQSLCWTAAPCEIAWWLEPNKQDTQWFHSNWNEILTQFGEGNSIPNPVCAVAEPGAHAEN